MNDLFFVFCIFAIIDLILVATMALSVLKLVHGIISGKVVLKVDQVKRAIKNAPKTEQPSARAKPQEFKMED